MSPWPPEGEPHGKGTKPVTLPRPGHADLAGVLKYGLDDVRNALERASARHTAVHVAAGSVAKAMLATIGIEVTGTTVDEETLRSAASTRPGPSVTRSAGSSRSAPGTWLQGSGAMRQKRIASMRASRRP